MRLENTQMKAFLKKYGIEAQPKYIRTGSMKQTWNLYGKGQKWTSQLCAKLTVLGFVDYDGQPLSEYSGNGGMFSVSVRYQGPEYFSI